MEYINHFTLNTGDTRKSYPKEIDREFLFNFKPMIKDIINNGIWEYIENSFIEITEEGDKYAATLYVKPDNELIPIFFTTGTSNQDRRKEIIKALMPLKKACGIEQHIIPPNAPLIIDIVMPAAIIRLDLLRYTGDMSRCLAWTILDPASIVAVE